MNRNPGIKEIREKCQPPDLDICLWRKFFARKLSAWLTWVFIRLGISANAVSVLKGIIACSGAMMFVPGDPALAVTGALLLQLSFILDACDGEVARYTGSCSRAGGEYVDKLGDALSKGLFFGAWGFALFHRTGLSAPLIAGTVMAGSWLVVRFCLVETLLESLSHHPDSEPGVEEKVALGRLFVRNPESGRVEYFLSAVVHPWLNIALPAAVSLFLSDLFMLGFFSLYVLFWTANTVRKLKSGFVISNFRRPERRLK